METRCRAGASSAARKVCLEMFSARETELSARLYQNARTTFQEKRPRPQLMASSSLLQPNARDWSAGRRLIFSRRRPPGICPVHDLGHGVTVWIQEGEATAGAKSSSAKETPITVKRSENRPARARPDQGGKTMPWFNRLFPNALPNRQARPLPTIWRMAKYPPTP